MTTTLVTGATGTLGVPTVARLRAAGHDVRALSRGSGPDLTTGDLLTGADIREAVTGADTVLHLATGRRGKGDVEATRTLLEAATAAEVRHLVLISIVGIDDIPLAYYRDKVVIERLVRESGLPYTILRATQFHSFVEALFTAQRRSPVVVAPKFPFNRSPSRRSPTGWSSWPVRRPAGRVADIGGPEQQDVPELARLWALAPAPAARSCHCRCRGDRRRLPGRARIGAGPPYGRRTFADHLAVRTEGLR